MSKKNEVVRWAAESDENMMEFLQALPPNSLHAGPVPDDGDRFSTNNPDHDAENRRMIEGLDFRTKST